MIMLYLTETREIILNLSIKPTLMSRNAKKSELGSFVINTNANFHMTSCK